MVQHYRKNNPIDDHTKESAAKNDSFLDKLDAEGKAEEEERKIADVYAAKHGGDWFILSLMERRAWKAVYPGKLYECGMNIPEMPDTAEGRYWKMGAKERKAWKLTNATPWLFDSEIDGIDKKMAADATPTPTP